MKVRTNVTRNKWVVIAASLGLMLTMAIPAGAAGWSQKVTGGGQASAAGTDFSITTSASDVGGQIQYSRSDQAVPDLSVHAKVECLTVAANGSSAVAAGPAFAQDDPSGAVFPGAWLQIEVLEGGDGSGDRVRVRILTEEEAKTCTPTGLYPGAIYDGNFNIRTK